MFIRSGYMGLIQYLNNANTAVMIGMCKNAGKTTAMNSLIDELAEDSSKTVALTSIGRDGESRDLVTGTDKPAIYMYEGMIAATVDSLLNVCDVSREIIGLSGMYTSMGQVVIFKARSDGFVQLAGPSIVDQMSALKTMLFELGADFCIIDGALARRSPAASSAGGVCILSTGASLGRDIDSVVDETAFAAEILSLGSMDAPGRSGGKFTLFSGGEVFATEEMQELNLLLKKRPEKKAVVLCEGAFTQSHAEQLHKGGADKEGLTILASDGSRYLLKSDMYGSLKAAGVSFAVRNALRLAAITVNPVSAGGWKFDKKEFFDKMSMKSNVPVLNVKDND